VNPQAAPSGIIGCGSALGGMREYLLIDNAVAGKSLAVFPATVPFDVAHSGRFGQRLPALQVARRWTSQMVAAMRSRESASSQPPSIHWNGQNRLSGW